MKTIPLRKVPDDVHAVLRSRAAAGGVSLSDVVLERLERIVTYPPLDGVLARTGSRSGGASAAAIVEAVRAEPDAR